MNGVNNISAQNQIISQNLLREKNLFNSLILQSGSKQVDQPKGKLLATYDPVTSLMVSAVDTGKDVRNFVKAIATGKSDDTSLGRMNDVGLKIGGLGIASYLATKRVTSTAKGMEFVGFAAFMAAMTLWPKIFINFPMYLKHGFHIDQKYQDSNGKKKDFSLDNQYRPLDLWKAEEIDAIADKNHIDKDIKDRRELTENWIYKTSLQGKTLATLTAGIAVPLATSMVCSAAEKKLIDFNINRAVEKATAGLENMGKTLAKPLDKNTSKAFEAILSEYKAKPLDGNFYSRLGELFNPLGVIKNEIDGDSIKLISGMNYEQSSKNTAEAIKEVAERAIERFNAAQAVKTQNAESVTSGLVSLLGDKLKIRGGISDTSATTVLDAEKLKGILGNGDLNAQKVLKILKARNVTVEDGDLKAAIEGIFGGTEGQMKEVVKAIRGYAAKDLKEARLTTGALGRFANALAGKRAESVYTRGYNGISSAFTDRMNPSMEQMRRFIDTSRITDEIKTTKSLITRIKELLRPVAKKAGEKEPEKECKTAEEFVIRQIKKIAEWKNDKKPEDSVDYFIKNIKKHLDEMDKFDRPALSGMKKFTDTLATLKDDSIRTAMSNFIRRSRVSNDGTAMRLFAALDLEKRLLSTSVRQNYSQKVIKTAQDIIYRATTITSAESLLVSKGDPEVYKQALKLLFGDKIDKEVKGAMGGELGDLFKDFKNFRAKMLSLYNRQIIDNTEDAVSLGEPIINLFKKGCKKKYNTTKWMQIFGAATVGIIGITLLAQFFIGKSKKEQELYKNKGAKNAV